MHQRSLRRDPLRADFTAERWRGFTLIELITVLVILGIVAAVLLGSAAHARALEQRARTRTELAVLAQSLEAYRAQYGGFPRTTDAAACLQALIGRRALDGTPIRGKSFLDLARFRTEGGRDPWSDRDRC